MSRDSFPIEEQHAPVLELALLRILPPFTIADASLRANLIFAKQVLQANSHNTFTGAQNPFYIYTQVEDPSLVYIIGSWPTLSEHHCFLASDANKDLLNRLEDQVVVEWMFHVDVPMGVIPLEAPVMSIGRYKMPSQNVQGYATTFAHVQRYLAEYVKPQRWAHGRRIDREVGVDGRGHQIVLRDRDEYVLFCGWESVERHLGFANTGGFQEFSALRGYLLEADIKHIKRLDL